MSDEERISELKSAFSLVAAALFEAGSVADTLHRIVNLAQDTIDGCDGAGIMVIERGQATTRASSQPLVERFDRIQIDAGEGPCLEAAESGTMFYAADLIGDERWPTFAREAAEAGLRSVLALSLTTRHLSALNLYALLPDAFESTDRAQADLFATLARLALESAEGRADASDRLDNLGEALRSRELIGQAQGILMERDRITAADAFAVLRRASQRLSIKLTEVARRLVETGEPPG